MDGDERVDEASHGRRQRPVGADEIGPQRVATDGRHLTGGEHRRHRRLCREGHIGVPPVVVARRLRSITDAERVVLAVEHQHLGVLVVEPRHERMSGRQVAERSAEHDELARREVLVADEDHAPYCNNASRDGGESLWSERSGQIEVTQLGPDRGGHGFDGRLHAHHTDVGEAS